MTRTEHLLEILAEECAETAQRVSKAKRFSLAEIQPGQDFTNADRIVEEADHILAALEMLRDEGLLPKSCPERIAKKKTQVERFLLYSKSLGTLTEEP